MLTRKMARISLKKVVVVSLLCLSVLLLVRVLTQSESGQVFLSLVHGEGSIQHAADRQVQNPAEEAASSEMVERRFQKRREVLQAACRLYGNSSLFKPFRAKTGFVPVPLYRPLMNKTIYYCAIAKTATTTWSGFLWAIKTYMAERGLQPSSDWEQGDGQLYFTFVREPYSRLLSAYVDKLWTPNPLFWRVTGRHAVRHFRPDASESSQRCGQDLTFPEFVKYVIESQRTGQHRDAHFVPTHDHCHMCRHPYHYIGHLETLSEDMPHITRAMGSPIQYGRAYDRDTIAQNARMVFLRDKRVQVEKCMDLDEAARRLWRKYQSRGLIHKHQRFPYPRGAALNITLAQFTEKALQAYEASKDKPDRKAQRVESLREAFAQVPLEDRIQLQQTLFLDFQMFGFDPFLEDVFPREPYQPDTSFSYFRVYD